MKSVTGTLLGLLLSLPVLAGGTITVNDAADTSGVCATTGTGSCTFRDALAYANAHAGSTIAFAISGAGVHTLAPASAYPDITAQVTINGFTQPGSSANTGGPGAGDDSVHLIELNGAGATGSGLGLLRFKAGSAGSAVRGLVINRTTGAAVGILGVANVHVDGCFLGLNPAGAAAPGSESDGVLIDDSATNATVGGATPAERNVIAGHLNAGIDLGGGHDHSGSGHVIQGNFIGLNAAGTAAVASPQTGIAVTRDAQNIQIGGTAADARNVISGNGGRGISISSSIGALNVTGIVVQGNFIGTDAAGTALIGNGFHNVSVSSAGNTIGGPAAGAGNVIVGSNNNGIDIDQATGLVIQGNFIGTDLTGLLAMPNKQSAIVVNSDDVTIGGTGAGEGNVIAFNGTPGFASGGVKMIGGSGIRIRGNSIHDNVGTGIDIGTDGVTPNDAGDADGGPNGTQNFPLLKTVTTGASTEVTGVIHSTAGAALDLDFYANPSCSRFPRDFIQGQTYLGTSPVTTDGTGNATFDVTLPATAAGTRISVTATTAAGSTSEFSQRLPFTTNVHSGPAAGGTGINIAGTDFAAGATVTVGGQPATGVVVNSPLSIDAVVPALAPGTANDLTVVNADGTQGTLAKAFVTDFLDVPGGGGFSYYVVTLVSNGITAGIGGGLYGLNDNTLRQQMAVFLLKASHGLCYTPPPCAGTFTDVPCSSNFAPWIEQLAAEGITGGCGGTSYCPQNSVRRDQMAVFLLKTEHGPSYVPPPCVGTFADVSCSSNFAPWIERLAAENITGGCGNNNYCPTNPNTRGQMAVFITKTFGLQ